MRSIHLIQVTYLRSHSDVTDYAMSPQPCIVLNWATLMTYFGTRTKRADSE